MVSILTDSQPKELRIPEEKVAILDCGAQYTKVIDRRVRELNIYSEILPLSTVADCLKEYSAIILSGGPHSVFEKDAPQFDSGILELGIPVLGICYGMQLIANHLGGKVIRGDIKEFGETLIEIETPTSLFKNLPSRQTVLMSHGDRVVSMPEGFIRLASSGEIIGRVDNLVHEDADSLGEAKRNRYEENEGTQRAAASWAKQHRQGVYIEINDAAEQRIDEEDAPQGPKCQHVLAAMADPERAIYGVQFHPEVELTEHGQTILKNFLYGSAGLTGSYKLGNRLDNAISYIKETVGDGNLFVLVSGGVDSAVTAALLLKAVGPEKLFALHVDTGLMRHNESEAVCQGLKALGLKHLRHIKAEDIFLNAMTDIDGHTVGPLHRLTNPEEKRRVIGDTFFRLAQDAISDMNLDLDATFIAQGTLRPDLIESGNADVSQIAHKIKTHHNDIPLIQEQREKGLIIEPNRDWHKDEVRQIGRMLGLPEEIVNRQPFPGPGLGIRVLCADKPYLTPDFRELNRAINRRVMQAGLQGNVLPVKSVGVQGDFRTYSYLSVLSGDYPEDWESLKAIALDIPNRYHKINRVALIIKSRSPLPEEITAIIPTFLTSDILVLLRAVDFEVTETFREKAILPGISQLLSVLIPVDVGNGGLLHSVAIRAVVTSDYMTARPARLGDEIPWSFIRDLADLILSRYPVSSVMYDLTSKPPATVEWE